jgi:hypothetical protein
VEGRTVRFVKKPIVVEAWEVTDLINRWNAYGVNGLPLSVAEGYENGLLEFPTPFLGDFSVERLDVITPEGIMQARHGWWLVRGIKGEFYPCRDDVFETTYSPLKENA